MIFQEIFSHRINTFLIDIEAGVFVFFVLVNLYLLELGSWVIIEQRVLDFHLISLKNIYHNYCVTSFARGVPVNNMSCFSMPLLLLQQNIIYTQC